MFPSHLYSGQQVQSAAEELKSFLVYCKDPLVPHLPTSFQPLVIRNHIVFVPRCRTPSPSFACLLLVHPSLVQKKLSHLFPFSSSSYPPAPTSWICLSWGPQCQLLDCPWGVAMQHGSGKKRKQEHTHAHTENDSVISSPESIFKSLPMNHELSANQWQLTLKTMWVFEGSDFKCNSQLSHPNRAPIPANIYWGEQGRRVKHSFLFANSPSFVLLVWATSDCSAVDCSSLPKIRAFFVFLKGNLCFLFCDQQSKLKLKFHWFWKASIPLYWILVKLIVMDNYYRKLRRCWYFKDCKTDDYFTSVEKPIVSHSHCGQVSWCSWTIDTRAHTAVDHISFTTKRKLHTKKP